MNVDIENEYYNSKVLVETDPEAALAGFAEVVRMKPEKAEWGFKALKQTFKLFYRLGRYKEMMEAYRVMLTYIKSAVMRNYSEKCINNIIDFTTLKALEEAKNERLWFKTNLKLCKIWFDMGEYGRMIMELHKSCQKEDGTHDQKKGKRQWAEAATDFFEGFKNYNEARNQRYLVLANMLMESEVNPFDGQEAKLWKGMKKYAAIDKWNTQLRSIKPLATEYIEKMFL
ncbi:hypothetical protein UlMin_007434 [Ulmus minor]